MFLESIEIYFRCALSSCSIDDLIAECAAQLRSEYPSREPSFLREAFQHHGPDIMTTVLIRRIIMYQPEHLSLIEDALPTSGASTEDVRKKLCDVFRTHPLTSALCKNLSTLSH